MTDFVLESAEQPYIDGSKYKDVISYAKFLKQPLKLGMFVPCDEDGNVLEEPEYYKDYFLSNDKFGNLPYVHSNEWFEDCDQYSKSEDLVLFYGIFICNTKKGISDFSKWLESIGNIESLLHIPNINISLTQSALKQIGL